MNEPHPTKQRFSTSLDVRARIRFLSACLLVLLSSCDSGKTRKTIQYDESNVVAQIREVIIAWGDDLATFGSQTQNDPGSAEDESLNNQVVHLRDSGYKSRGAGLTFSRSFPLSEDVDLEKLKEAVSSLLERCRQAGFNLHNVRLTGADFPAPQHVSTELYGFGRYGFVLALGTIIEHSLSLTVLVFVDTEEYELTVDDLRYLEGRND